MILSYVIVSICSIAVFYLIKRIYGNLSYNYRLKKEKKLRSSGTVCEMCNYDNFLPDELFYVDKEGHHINPEQSSNGSYCCLHCLITKGIKFQIDK